MLTSTMKKKLKNGLWVVYFITLLERQRGKEINTNWNGKVKEELRYGYGVIFAYNGKFATISNRMAVMT